MTSITEFSAGLYSAGQPTPGQLDALAHAGVRTVVNLRAPGEPVEYDEARHARDLGLAYICIPVSGAQDLTREKARQLADAIATATPLGATLIHCASGNRVGALVALAAAWEWELAPQQAQRLGVAAGLQGLQPVVANLLA
jgi:protein tyrosine phosphatase (PTP) superfamily phosphohydrolase (DUF442 family)